jgi:hypothetical protein
LLVFKCIYYVLTFFHGLSSAVGGLTAAKSRQRAELGAGD